MYRRLNPHRKRLTFADFSEYEEKHNPKNLHYRGTKNRRFEKLAGEIIDERQDKNRRRFMRAQKRLQTNKMAAMRTRQPNFSEDSFDFKAGETKAQQALRHARKEAAWRQKKEDEIRTSNPNMGREERASLMGEAEKKRKEKRKRRHGKLAKKIVQGYHDSVEKSVGKSSDAAKAANKRASESKQKSSSNVSKPASMGSKDNPPKFPVGKAALIGGGAAAALGAGAYALHKFSKKNKKNREERGED